MANTVKTESGIDLLQRLSVRPKLLGLQNEVFGENRLQPHDVIDYWKKFQPQNMLKTVSLTQWIIHAVYKMT
jgi:hypothetical protein